MASAGVGEDVMKLKRHLTLLREEYVKLHNKYVELERKYEVAVANGSRSPSELTSPTAITASVVSSNKSTKIATSGSSGTFISRLLKKIADLFESELYSDMTIVLNGMHLRAHTFVLTARSDHWGVPSLADVDQLDMSELAQDVAYALLKWVYTDNVDLGANEAFLLDLMKAASIYELLPLVHRCEAMLMSTVNERNCIKFYTVADEINTEGLKNHCSELISNHWDDFTAMDFAHMPAPLLYKMFKSKSSYPLHMAIRVRREDVIFLLLMEFDSELSTKLNEIDAKGNLALDLALRDRQEGIALTLVSHNVNVDACDADGRSLLHKAIERGDEFAATFLIEHRASVAFGRNGPVNRRTTPLHLVANSLSRGISNPETHEGMIKVARLLLQRGSHPNVSDELGNTSLHIAIQSRDKAIFSAILEVTDLDLEALNDKGQTALWLALDVLQTNAQREFAEALIKRGSSPMYIIDKQNGDSLLHQAIRCSYSDASQFLCDHGASINHSNKKGETPLHVACSKGLAKVTLTLLLKGGNANLQTSAPTTLIATAVSPDQDDEDSPLQLHFKHTPLHVAIYNGHRDCVNAIIDHKTFCQRSQQQGQLVEPNFDVTDSSEQTSLGLALFLGQMAIARRLLAGGASIEVRNGEGLTLLHQAILHQETQIALFLLENGIDPVTKTCDNKSSLQLAINSHMPEVVAALCAKGVDMGGEEANDLLWSALESGQENIANILVRHDCDTNRWSAGPDGCEQTLLHRAIDENNECAACFLIRSGCNVNVTRRPGSDGNGGDEAFDLQTPLHLSCTWGLENVCRALLEHGANINAQDTEGKTPLHVAIINHHFTIVSMLIAHPALDLSIQNKQLQTAFAVAMLTKNNKAAQAILKRKPMAAEEFNSKGLNFLHLAIQKGDIESVLFLLSINVTVKSRVQDQTQLTPLHLAVLSGSEILVRNLILAGSNVNDLTPQKQTALHLAASQDQAAICSILLENGIQYDATDENQNNALHVAVQRGHFGTVKVLLTESRINAETINSKGQNPLHVLCQHGKESAATIFELFVECMPEYPVNKVDPHGNTPLLLAYMNGNGALCRAIVRLGACLGAANHHGVSIFNYQVATKQLLFRLLDLLTKEPQWSEGDICLECGTKFGIATRRHHCRHCGRLLCSKCSAREMPILKFNLNKPVRVCDTCFDVLVMGTSS